MEHRGERLLVYWINVFWLQKSKNWKGVSSKYHSTVSSKKTIFNTSIKDDLKEIVYHFKRILNS